MLMHHKKNLFVYPYWVSQKEVVPFFIYLSQHCREFFKIKFMDTNYLYLWIQMNVMGTN